MLLAAWLFVGVVAVLATLAAVATSDNAVAIVAGVLGVVTWGVVAYGALNLEVVTDSGVETFTVPAMTLVAVACALIPAFIALTGPIELASRARDGRPDEV